MITIIIPVKDIKRYENIKDKSLNNLKNCEIIIVEGKNPSFQRNEAVKKSKGEIIYFIDDDSMPERDNLKKVEKIFRSNEKIAIIGGPALQTEFSTYWQKIFNEIFGCVFATGKSRARYKKIGIKRESDEKEIILCNMFIKKDIFIKSGGFLPELYPNEENEFLNRIKKYGYKIIYEPDIIVKRPHRKDFLSFLVQCFRYGKGRAEQIFFRLTKGDLINLVPAFFIFYLISLIFIKIKFYYIPLIFYIILDTFYSLKSAINIKDIKSFFVFFISFFSLHFFYGAGFIFGFILKLFGYKRKLIKDLKLKKIKL